ncbi:MAG: 30S ribosomal protein THX [Flavobacteriales bacterium]|nr:30S ribosomal protein THX [Flavobacteriales bacterium]
MGKGDIKSKRGKIANGSYGVRRQKQSSDAYVAPVVAKKAEPKAQAETEKAETTKKPAAKKAPAKKAAAKK